MKDSVLEKAILFVEKYRRELLDKQVYPALFVHAASRQDVWIVYDNIEIWNSKQGLDKMESEVRNYVEAYQGNILRYYRSTTQW